MALEEKIDILLVDDKPENFLVLEGCLEDLKLNFIKATSGKEALGLTLEHDLALILLDVQMPDMDGFETARLIRGVERTKYLPIIFVTAISKERQFVFKGYEVGAVDYLFKPINPDILRAKVRVFLDLYRKKQELEAEIAARKETEEKLREAEKALQTANEELEERVKERTTELEIAYRQLLHAEKLSAVGRLSASIAHEVNNPLFGIRNVLGGIKRRVLLDKEEEDLVVMALQECDRIKALVQDLMDFKRPSAGIMAPMDVHAALNGILLLLKKELKTKQIKVDKHYAADLPLIQAVGDQIKQVLLNLLNNAVDAIPAAGGRISITTALIDEMVAIHIRDSGMGIKPENLDRIFEPFFTTKSAVKGTGLGLSVSYGIIKRHGGRIEVESRPDQGSTFTVFLPLANAH